MYMRLSYEVRDVIMGSYDKNKTCCFIGHRKINETDGLRTDLYSKIEDLIINDAVCNFLFGSRSNLNDLCLEIVTKLKEKI